MSNDKLVVKSRRPKGEEGYKVFSVGLHEKSVSRIVEIALQTGRNRYSPPATRMVTMIGLLVRKKSSPAKRGSDCPNSDWLLQFN